MATACASATIAAYAHAGWTFVGSVPRGRYTDLTFVRVYVLGE